MVCSSMVPVGTGAMLDSWNPLRRSSTRLYQSSTCMLSTQTVVLATRCTSVQFTRNQDAPTSLTYSLYYWRRHVTPITGSWEAWLCCVTLSSWRVLVVLWYVGDRDTVLFCDFILLLPFFVFIVSNHCVISFYKYVIINLTRNIDFDFTMKFVFFMILMKINNINVELIVSWCFV